MKLNIDQKTFWKDLVLEEDGEDWLVRDENGHPMDILAFENAGNELFCPFISSDTTTAINTAFDKKSSNEIYLSTYTVKGGADYGDL